MITEYVPVWLAQFHAGHYRSCPKWALHLLKATREETGAPLAAACNHVAWMLSDYWPS